MQLKRNILTSVMQLVTCALIALGAATFAQAEGKTDPSGTWEWVAAARGSAPARTNTLVLKLEGDKLTGTLSMPGRDGKKVETKIEEATLKGDEISFTVTREFRNNKMSAKYSGKVTADAIKGKVEAKGRDGNPASRDWEAKKK